MVVVNCDWGVGVCINIMVRLEVDTTVLNMCYADLHFIICVRFQRKKLGNTSLPSP